MNLQLADLTQIVTAVIGVLGEILILLLGRKKPLPFQKAVLWICGLLIVFNLIFAGWRVYFTQPEVRINYPADQGTVQHREVALGTYRWLPFAQRPWLVIYSHSSGRYYPQNEPAFITLNDEWYSIIFLGLEDTTNEPFDILAVMPNRNARRDFKEYLDTGNRSGSWPGLGHLPDGSIIYDRIMVTRK